MTQSASTTTVRPQILVDAPMGEAFKVFTERFGEFKPREHYLLQATIAENVLEPRVGGNSRIARSTAASADGRQSSCSILRIASSSAGTGSQAAFALVRPASGCPRREIG